MKWMISSNVLSSMCVKLSEFVLVSSSNDSKYSLDSTMMWRWTRNLKSRMLFGIISAITHKKESVLFLIRFFHSIIWYGNIRLFSLISKRTNGSTYYSQCQIKTELIFNWIVPRRVKPHRVHFNNSTASNGWFILSRYFINGSVTLALALTHISVEFIILIWISSACILCYFVKMHKLIRNGACIAMKSNDKH